jgi:sulfite exporter TauE/SafE
VIFAVLAGIVATSALGSIHCIAMCGPLVGLHGGARTLRLALVHALGRLFTYAVLGAAAGALGSALDLAGRLASIQHAAMLVAAALILAPFLLSPVFRLAKVSKEKESRSKGAGSLGVAERGGAAFQRSSFRRALVKIGTRKPGRRAWIMGAITGLLPCGWLWAFVVTAGGMGGVAMGAAVMAAFWLGTVPAMVGLLTVAGPVVERLRARMPAVTAIVMIALALGVLALRWHDAGSVHCQMCYGAAT